MQHPAITSCLCFATESFSFTISGENWKTVSTAAVLFSLLELNHYHQYFFVEFIDIHV
jgi:hypothetical protein